MSQTGGLPPLPPLTPPTPLSNSPLQAELQAQGRRAGLRAAFLTKLGSSPTTGSKSTNLGGTK
jgi:hypothetical protein